MMHIPVLNQLETRTEWVSFFRRERSYAYTLSPLCLVDFQTTFLHLTLLDEVMLDGRQAIKYSLGSKTSMEPAWQLIKACDWQLSAVTKGLSDLDFKSNVRDNSFLGVHSDLSVRKYFAKDKTLIAPTLVRPLAPIIAKPYTWDLHHICCLLSHQQLSDPCFIPAPLKEAPIKSILLRLLDTPAGWSIQEIDNTLLLRYQDKAILSFTPTYTVPAPRLKEDTSTLWSLNRF